MTHDELAPLIQFFSINSFQKSLLSHCNVTSIVSGSRGEGKKKKNSLPVKEEAF
jgi:hypothetical protein